MKKLVLATWALVATLALPSLAGAANCASTCGAAKRTCQLARVTAFRACRGVVKASGSTGQDRRDAIKTCRSAFKEAQQTCLGALHDCLHACTIPPSNVCASGCVSEGQTCLHDVVASGQSCVKACPAGPGRLQCVAACAAQAKGGLAQCRASFHMCLAGCPSSPSGAFLD